MINSDIAKSTYTTVPGATEYAIGFEYYWNLDDTPQLFVTLNGEELVYGVGYTISGDGLNVVLAMEPDEPATLIIVRNVPFTQTSDYVIGRIDPDQIERDFDLAMMRTQQNKVTIDTAVDIVNDCVDEVSELKSDVEETIDDVEQAVRDAEAAAETAASYETRLSNVEVVIPEGASSEDLLALKSEVDLAANSGSQLTNKGVWYAKMYAATVVPSGAEYDGRNYADFSQADGNGDPIIVLYEGQSGVWVQTQTITPPADYNGYVTVTSKIWDIVEQNGQQGGEVLWAYNTKTFTPYPKMVSFEDAALTGDSTVAMPLSPTNDNITNKGYVDTAIASAVAGYDTPELFDWKWRDATTSKTTWKLSDGHWINRADVAETAWDHLQHDLGHETASYPWVQVQSVTPNTFIRAADFDETGADYPYAYANITNGVLTLRYSTSSTGGSGISGPIYYNGPNAGASGWGAEYGGTMTSATLKIETVAGISVMCWLGEDGHKIVRPAWRPGIEYNTIVSGQDTAVDAIYAATGVAWYYILDGANQRLKLPRKDSVQIVRSVVNNDGSWYKLYANGWVEQGGITSGAPANVVLPIEMADTNYSIMGCSRYDSSGSGWFSAGVITTTGFGCNLQYGSGQQASGTSIQWEVRGQSAINMANEQCDQKYLYFYVGA